MPSSSLEIKIPISTFPYCMGNAAQLKTLLTFNGFEVSITEYINTGSVQLTSYEDNHWLSYSDNYWKFIPWPKCQT